MRRLMIIILPLLIDFSCFGQSNPTVKNELKEILTVFAKEAFRGEDFRNNEMLQEIFGSEYLEKKYKFQGVFNKDEINEEYEVNIVDEFYSVKAGDKGDAFAYVAKFEWQGYYKSVYILKNYDGSILVKGILDSTTYYPIDPETKDKKEMYVGKSWNDRVNSVKKLGFK